MKVIILGAGLAGLSCAYFVKSQDVRIYEKEDHVGGTAASTYLMGKAFDKGVHIFFSKNKDVLEIFNRSVDDKYSKRRSAPFNFYQGTCFKHPIQNNLWKLPFEVKKRCLLDYIRRPSSMRVRNYHDWCLRNYGQGIAEFYRMYTTKFYRTDPRDMTTDWIGNRISTPTLEEVIAGCFTEETEYRYYQDYYMYPRKGGFLACFSELFRELRTPVFLNSEARGVDVNMRTVFFKDGRREVFDKLVSSIPLPMLVHISNCPASIKKETEKLRWTSALVVNVVTKNSIHLPGGDWNYIYDVDKRVTRQSYPFILSGDEGNCRSIQVEIPFLMGKEEVDVKETVERVIRELIELKILNSPGEIVAQNSGITDFAYVIHDRNRRSSVRRIRGYFRERGVYTIGRFGEWDNLWSDQAILSGRRCAEELNRTT